MICQARIMAERILNNKTLTEQDILQAEILVRTECPEVQKLEELYNKLCIDKFHRHRENGDPTIQEEDRKAQKRWFGLF